MRIIITITALLTLLAGSLSAQLSRHRFPPPVIHSPIGKDESQRTSPSVVGRVSSSPGIVWGPTVKLSPDDPYPSGGSYTPHLAVQGDTIHCVWYGYSPFRLPYIRSTDDGFSWESPRDLITDSSGLPGSTITDAQKVVADNRSVFIFFAGLIAGVPSGQGGGVYVILSTDRGASWGNPLLTTGDTVSFFHAASVQGDTMVAVYTPEAHGQFPGPYPRVVRTANAGINWSRSFQQMPSSNSALLLRVVLTPGLLNFFHSGEQWPGPAPEIVLHRSTDVADSWKDSLVLSPIDGNGSDMPEVATFEHPGTGDVSNRTTLGVMWRGEEFAGAGFSAGMALRLSYDNGTTWQPMQIVSDTPRGSFHSLTIQGNMVAASWSYELGDFGPMRVKTRVSYDCGETWDSVYNLTPVAENAGVPSVALSASAIHVAWEEDTGPPNSPRWNVYYRRGTLVQMTPSLSSRTLDFDTVRIGCTRSQLVTIKNIRCDPLDIQASTLNELEYSVEPTSVIVNPKDSVTFTIRFGPVSIGDKSSQVILVHNQGAPDTVSLSATAVGTGTETVITDSFGVGWQLISVPVQPPCSYLFARSFFYQGSYLLTDTLLVGKGYWHKLTQPTASFAGSLVTDVSVPVQARWNIIGSVSHPLPVANITSNPPGIVTSQFFGYQGSYFASDSIYPGRAYWVKVTQSGELILSSSSAAASASNRIKIVVTSDVPPPPPPPGSGVSTTTTPVPAQFGLGQNYPNPFNPTTVIRYSLAVNSFVWLKVYDVLGREVKTLIDGEMQDAGFKQIQWDASQVPSGVYFYKITAGNFVDVKKMISLK